MRKRLFFINDQGGFFLPYVLFIIAIVLIILTTNLNTYKSDLLITDNHVEQLKIETLLQMARTKFKDEISELKADLNPVVYSFHDGIVEISYSQLSTTKYDLTFTIYTEKKSYSITNILLLDKI